MRMRQESLGAGTQTAAGSDHSHRTGDVYLWNAVRGGFLSSAIRFFTRSGFSHSSIGWFIGGEVQAQLEANLLVGLNPLVTGDPEYTHKRYRFRAIPEEVLAVWVRHLWQEFSGKQYGVLQLPWFVWRWLLQHVLKVKKEFHHTWFPNGTICSELVYQYFQFAALYLSQHGRPEFEKALEGYGADTVSPQDLWEIINACPQEFIAL